jgi:hypothetical protein
LLSNSSEEDVSSSSEDDSEAELINPQTEVKFLKELIAIREGDPTILTKTGDNSVGQ